MLRFFRWLGIGFGLLLAVLVVLLLSYYLPATAKVYVTGTEVKRLDVSSEEGAAKTRDVRYVVTKEVGSGDTMVFRNEDTGWGWPPYLKFNSGDIMGEAVNFHESDEKEVVLVTYYGWRLTWFSMYPNILSMRPVTEDYQHIPVFNIVFITLLLVLIGYVALKVWRWRRRRSDQVR